MGKKEINLPFSYRFVDGIFLLLLLLRCTNKKTDKAIGVMRKKQTSGKNGMYTKKKYYYIILLLLLQTLCTRIFIDGPNGPCPRIPLVEDRSPL